MATNDNVLEIARKLAKDASSLRDRLLEDSAKRMFSQRPLPNWVVYELGRQTSTDDTNGPLETVYHTESALWKLIDHIEGLYSHHLHMMSVRGEYASDLEWLQKYLASTFQSSSIDDLKRLRESITVILERWEDLDEDARQKQDNPESWKPLGEEEYIHERECAISLVYAYYQLDKWEFKLAEDSEEKRLWTELMRDIRELLAVIC
jgi:hypothetical protein